MRHLLSGLLMIASVTLATDAGAATPGLTPSSASLPAALMRFARAHPFATTATACVNLIHRAFYQDESRGIQGCGWLMRRAIDTHNRNWLQRYRACAR